MEKTSEEREKEKVNEKKGEEENKSKTG